jgi:SnoaL-like domain
VLTPREIGDHVEIVQLLQRYFTALDERDYDLLDAVFTPTATLSYSLDDAQPSPELPYAEMRERLREFNRRFASTQHLMGAPLIELAGDTARSRTGLRAIHILTSAGGQPSTWTVYGTYWDTYARTPAGWRICERVFKAFHTEGNP